MRGGGGEKAVKKNVTCLLLNKKKQNTPGDKAFSERGRRKTRHLISDAFTKISLTGFFLSVCLGHTCFYALPKAAVHVFFCLFVL